MQSLQSVSHPLTNKTDLDSLVTAIGDAQFVLLGEASHGTSEYYTWRTKISERLIKEKGFSVIAVEGDWPDCYQINKYIKGASSQKSTEAVLRQFRRWPTWMWANTEVASFMSYLQHHNIEAKEMVSFYGLDVYSLWDSLSAVLTYLEEKAPDAVTAARKAYACFEPHSSNLQAYAYMTQFLSQSCTEEVIAMLVELHSKRIELMQKGKESFFNAEQNALVVKNADAYYRVMLAGGATSWNVRDRHMMETLNRVRAYHGNDTKIIVWAHNTHVGDARATDMTGAGMVNIGQLVREEYGKEDTHIVGFGSYEGTVIAADAWDEPFVCMSLPQAQPGSWESLMHEELHHDALMLLQNAPEENTVHEVHGHRAIGVVYNSHMEAGNYVPTKLSARYDSFIYQEHTSCLHPYTISAEVDADVPETYPTGV